jgi:two-component system NtrC family sensor kinase
MELYVPITTNQDNSGEIVEVVEVYQNLDPIYADIQQNNRVIWGAVGAGFSFLYLILFGIVWRASKTMQEQTKRLIQSNKQLIQADKMVSLGTLSAGVAHEINNPNQHILSNIQLIGKFYDSAGPILDKYSQENEDFSISGVPYIEVRKKIPEMLSAIRNGSGRITRIVKDLGDFARQNPEEHSPGIDLSAVVESAEGLVQTMIKKSTRFFVKNLVRNLPLIRGNFQRLEQVIVNLIINACQALPDPSKKIVVSTSVNPREGYVILTVQDEGCGISKDDQRQLFDPFFTTRRDHGGTGLGLSISKSIVEKHNGTIVCKSELGKGTSITLKLPVKTITA